MPSTYAHYRFGREVLSKLPEEIRKIILNEQELFNMGLHGPDLLFYYKPLTVNEVNSQGYGIHSEAGIDFFLPASKEIMKMAFSPAYLAYIYGVICHFALDRECHGYIDEKIAESGVSHAEIEVEFDRRLMVYDGFDPITHILTEHIRPSKRSARVISSFYSKASADDIYRAMQSYVFYNRLLIAPSVFKREFVYGILKISGHYDEMHGLMVNYRPNPKCSDSNRELAVRYGRAIKKAVMLISGFEGSAKGLKPWCELYNYTFGSEYRERSYEV